MISSATLEPSHSFRCILLSRCISFFGAASYLLLGWPLMPFCFSPISVLNESVWNTAQALTSARYDPPSPRSALSDFSHGLTAESGNNTYRSAN